MVFCNIKFIAVIIEILIAYNDHHLFTETLCKMAYLPSVFLSVSK